jgi:hypothetical protein
MSDDLLILLSTLYETAPKARAIAEGIVQIQLVDEGNAAVVWSSILKQAWKEGSLAELVGRAAEHFPNHAETLRKAQNKYEARMAAVYSDQGPTPNALDDVCTRLGTADPRILDPIPVPPEFYAEPRYIGSHQFFGREHQLVELHSWASPSDPHPVMLFDAIGGAGKSMLTWEWATKHAPRIRKDWGRAILVLVLRARRYHGRFLSSCASLYHTPTGWRL